MALSDYEAALDESLLADIHRAYRQAYELAVRDLSYRDQPPELNLTLRSARMAGRASPHKNLIELNKVIFRNNPDWVFVYDTIAHEMAHIVASRAYRSRGHDAKWKRVALVLGATPKASGHFDTSNAEVRKPAQRKTYPFVCQCQSFEFGSQRFSNFIKGSRYQCRACKAEIKPNLEQAEAFEAVPARRMAKLKQLAR